MIHDRPFERSAVTAGGVHAGLCEGAFRRTAVRDDLVAFKAGVLHENGVTGTGGERGRGADRGCEHSGRRERRPDEACESAHCILL